MRKTLFSISIFLFIFTGCATTKNSKKMVITDEMVYPILEEEFYFMEEKIENNWESSKKPSVIIYFCYDERFGDQSVTVISNWIQGELESTFVNSGNYKIIDKSNLDRILKEQSFQQSGFVSDEAMVDMGRELGGNYLVFPKITRFNTLEIKITNIETAELIYTIDRTIEK